MRLVLIGATGNVGTSVLEALASESSVEEIVAVARRTPARSWPRTKFVAADVARDELAPLMRGAGAVMHLAWLIQPARDESRACGRSSAEWAEGPRPGLARRYGLVLAAAPETPTAGAGS